jgi:hypothetical protein
MSRHRNTIIQNYSQQDGKFLILFIFTEALHVSGGSSAHHQKHLTVHTASVVVNQYCCSLLPWKRWHLIYILLQKLYMLQAVPPLIIRST